MLASGEYWKGVEFDLRNGPWLTWHVHTGLMFPRQSGSAHSSSGIPDSEGRDKFFIRREDMWACHREVAIAAVMPASSTPCQATGKGQEINHTIGKIFTTNSCFCNKNRTEFNSIYFFQNRFRWKVLFVQARYCFLLFFCSLFFCFLVWPLTPELLELVLWTRAGSLATLLSVCENKNNYRYNSNIILVRTVLYSGLLPNIR